MHNLLLCNTIKYASLNVGIVIEQKVIQILIQDHQILKFKFIFKILSTNITLTLI